jgi:hypothetical protein
MGYLCLSLLRQPPIDLIINYLLSTAVGFSKSNNRQEIPACSVLKLLSKIFSLWLNIVFDIIHK